MSTTQATEDYPYIRAWGRYMGSMQYYISEQVREARAAGAPQNAIYERDGVWFTTDDITSQDMRQALQLPLHTGTEQVVLDKYDATIVAGEFGEHVTVLSFKTLHRAAQWDADYHVGATYDLEIGSCRDFKSAVTVILFPHVAETSA